MCKKPCGLTAFFGGLFAFERAHLRTQMLAQPDFRVKWENSRILCCIKTTLLNYFCCICATFKIFVDSDCHCVKVQLSVDCSLFAFPAQPTSGDTFQTTDRCSG